METTTEFLVNVTDEDDYSIAEGIEEDHDWIFRFFLEAYTLLSVVCLTCNVLIALVILKYRRIMQEKSNIIILNWCITNIFFLAFNPTTIRLAVDFDHRMINVVFCVVQQLECSVLFVNITQMVLLTFYWYMKLYASSAFLKLMNHLIFALICIYVFSTFLAGIHVDACYNRRLYRLAEVILALSYVAYILFTFIINVIHVVKKHKILDYKTVVNIPLIMTNSFCLSCIPIFVIGFLGFAVTPAVHQALVCSSLILCVMNPLFFFIILFKFDKDYNTFFRHVLSCRCSDYKEELVEHAVVYNSA